MAEDRRQVMALAISVVAAFLGGPTGAQARVQPYQITRLITFKTECQIEKIEDRPAPVGRLRFLATCENVSFYPDGVDVTCSDRDDDRSCQVTTRAKSFDSLHLLDHRR